MKGLVLHQPFASLVAAGAKRIETRSWRPRQVDRDRLVVVCASAAKAPRSDYAHGQPPPPLSSAFVEYAIGALGVADFDALPKGAAVCVVTLLAIGPTEQATPTPFERLAGDYRPGRWAWAFGNVRRFATPVPVRGARGLFRLDGPTERLLAAAMAEAEVVR